MVCSVCSATESKKWLAGKCVTCWNREYYRKNIDKKKEKERNTSYYQQNKERIKAKAAEWANENRDSVRQASARWSAKNPQIRNYRESLRRAKKKNATPKWLTPEQLNDIKDIYLKCPEGHEVDHILPLQGKEISGLHVPWNLQYLPSLENRIKGNRLKEAYVE